MDLSEYVGKTFEAHTNIRLPRGRYVAPGDTFRLLQMHVDRGVRPDLWVATGNATIVEDRPQRVPTGGAGRESNRERKARERAEREAAELAALEAETVADGGGDLPPADDGSGAPDFPPAETVEV